MVRELDDADRKWLEELDDRIRPKDRQFTPKSEMVKLTYDEVDRVFYLVDNYNLVTELCGNYSMFGGCGVAIYAHEQFFGTGAELLCVVTEDNLLGPRPPSWYQRISDDDAENKIPTYSKRKAGGVDPYAWDLFNRYTRRPSNVEWLDHYELKPNKEQVHFEY